MGAAQQQTRRELWADYVILATYDELRSTAGHDYGAGQRAAELSRRRRNLPEPLELELTPTELSDAFRRVAVPRIARLDREDFRQHTQPTLRTLKTWERVRRLFPVDPELVDATEHLRVSRETGAVVVMRGGGAAGGRA